MIRSKGDEHNKEYDRMSTSITRAESRNGDKDRADTGTNRQLMLMNGSARCGLDEGGIYLTLVMP
jgi:hypothetical protein